ncbi:MAG: DUF6094 domain-containing protein [Chloroflexota bacterium]|nr:MAG: hypothetical protein KatS3mg045_0971 [Bellilinea sp.]
MRLAGIEKGGYYPYPPHMAEATTSWFVPLPVGTRGRLLDPCCGEGEIASILGKLLNCETWGCELFPYRAEKAAARMDKCHSAAWESCSLTDESVTILWLNPPYDDDRHGDEKRLELAFLKSTTPKLVRGGTLAFIIPHRILRLAEIARYLASQYERLTALCFPDGEFERFKQILLLATRREKYNLPTNEEIEAIQKLAESDLPTLGFAPEPVYPLLPAPLKGAGGRAITFRQLDWAPDDLVEASRWAGVRKTRAWQDLVHPVNREIAFTPTMPLKKGHLAMLMASGLMGALNLTDDEGHPMLVKGRVIKVVDKTTHRDDHDPETLVERFRDRYVTTVATLSAAHGLEIIQDTERLTDFMKAHGDKIAAHTLAAYRPLYDLKPSEEELAILDRLGKQRKPLPGQSAPGLLPTQKHAAIAAARAIQIHRTANVQGEMGSGKSSIGLAVIELLDAYPALILCPPHLVPKWIREAEDVIPRVKARELRRIGKGTDGDVNDVRTFLDDYDSGKLGCKAIAVVASTAAKMGAGWKPVVHAKTIKLNGKPLVVYTCPQCGQVQTDNQGIPVTEIEHFQKHRSFCSAQVSGWKLDTKGRRVRDQDGNPVWETRPCAAPLFEYSEARRYSIAEYIKDKAHGRFKILIGDECHEYKSKSSDRGVAFHQLAEATMYTLTLTGTYFGGRSTSIFWLLHRLTPSVRQDFAFHDELRWANAYGLLESVRKRKVDNDLADEDGAFTGNRRYRDQAHEIPGVSPAIITRLLHNSIFLNLKDLGIELPPYAEEVVELEMEDAQARQYQGMESILRHMACRDSRYLSLWLQWALARPNSAFRDEVVMLNRTAVPANQLAALGKELLDSTGDSEMHHQVAQVLLEAARTAQTAAGKREKEVIVQSPLMPLPAVLQEQLIESNLLPKERWLTSFCQSEKAQRRRVLVYVRQTGTRDIQERIETVLENAGLRVITLYSSVDPRKREAWIDRHADVDVLITNPRLVATGLDLVNFASVVFAEVEYSLYVLWQALRRVWRLGQTKPVKAVFSVYRGTMEAQALALMGRKMRAAQLLYGDNVGGAIVPLEDGDFITELAREVLRGAQLDDLQSLFADEMQMSNSPMGCPTETSSILVPIQPRTWDEWLRSQDLSDRMPASRRTGRRSSLEAPGQLSIWHTMKEK